MREVIAIFVLVFGFFVVLAGPEATPAIPQCEEDAVIIGDGDFENGRWERYECGPSVDDYIVMPM